MTRKCSHCGTNGHNSRTCPDRGPKLFGVRLTGGPMRKSASMGNLSHFAGPDETADRDGYASEDLTRGGSSASRDRKRGVPWTEEEHRKFLQGLQKLGKGDWRGISRSYVVSRTPTQVASHAQKYFIRQTNYSRRRRRASLFDLPPSVAEPDNSSQDLEPNSDPNPNPKPESMVSDPPDPTPDLNQNPMPVLLPAYYPPFVPIWLGPVGFVTQPPSHIVIKPTAVHRKDSINVVELVEMTKLSLGEVAGPTLSLGLEGESRSQSAFHVNAPLPPPPVKVHAV